MRKIVITILSILVLIVFDLGSKDYIEKNLTREVCLSYEKESFSYSQGAIGGLSPGLFCSPEYRDGVIYESYQGQGLSIIGEYLKVQLSYNTGIAFSLPIEGLPLQIITIIILIGLIVYYVGEEYPKKSRLLDIGYTLIFAGALSHAYERIVAGHVVDFIAVKYFAILNFADIFISIGAACIICYYIFYEKRNPR